MARANGKQGNAVVMDRVALRQQFEDLLYREAWLLDQDRLEEWLDLLSENIHYWAPVRADMNRGKEDFSPPLRLAFFDDNKDGLRLRVARIRTGAAHADEPPSRVRHLITNVQVMEAPDTETTKVASNFLVFKSRRNREENLFVGCREDTWRLDGGAWKLDERMILLDHNVIENITVLF
jgi:3-phenylpropionate/cinnamic acid dioxygenase small subunit